MKHRTTDSPKMVNIFILYVSTLHLSHLQKNTSEEECILLLEIRNVKNKNVYHFRSVYCSVFY